ncbi:hypothetical protein AGMMS49975_16650 [Clostridia bacterium]|nr:hypothetical protein AGMMS49975_16650 [Clostridia bacterium]
MSQYQSGDYNVTYWVTGECNEWYEFRVEKFDKNDKVVLDKVVLIAIDDVSREFIGNSYLADMVAKSVPVRAKIRLEKNPPFVVKRI